MKLDTGIDAEGRARVAQGLARLLADSHTLALKTRGFHWNVQGPMLGALHLLFAQQSRELYAAVDGIAARIRALGHPSPGSHEQFVSLSAIPEALEPPAARAMIEQLVADHEAVARSARPITAIATEVGDVASADLLRARVQLHEEAAWKLRALQAG